MFAADQRDDRAEAAFVQVDQGAAVAVFLDRHAVEDGGGGGEIGAQAFGIAAIDARVILFGADRKGQNLLFRQIGKAAAVAEGGKHGTPFLE